MTVSYEVVERFEASLVDGSSEAIADWAATGAAGLLHLRDYLDGRLDPLPADGVNAIVLIDNTSASVAAIAAAHPESFLEAFEADRFREDTFVLTGLGQIDDPRATDRLARAASSRDQWVRMHAAIGLGRRVSPLATATLEPLLTDDEYLVRYHSLKSLAGIGDIAAVPALRRMVPPTPREAELIAETIASITDRASDGRVSG